MKGKLFVRCTLIAALFAPAAVWADSGSGSGSSYGSGSASSSDTGTTTHSTTHSTSKSKSKAAMNPKAGQETLSDADLAILAHVHDVNLSEIEMGQLASLRATQKSIKTYADMIVKDHQKADKQVMALAKARSATLPTTPSAPDEIANQQRAMETMDRLRGMTGADFDRAFLQAMADDHDREVTKIDDSIKNATDTRLAAELKTMRPVLAKHANAAKKLLTKAAETHGTEHMGTEHMGSGSDTGSSAGSGSADRRP